MSKRSVNTKLTEIAIVVYSLLITSIDKTCGLSINLFESDFGEIVRISCSSLSSWMRNKIRLKISPNKPPKRHPNFIHAFIFNPLDVMPHKNWDWNKINYKKGCFILKKKNNQLTKSVDISACWHISLANRSYYLATTLANTSVANLSWREYFWLAQHRYWFGIGHSLWLVCQKAEMDSFSLGVLTIWECLLFKTW